MAVPAVETNLATIWTSNVQTVEIVKPSGIADDDVILIGVALDGAPTNPNMDAETGWTRLANISEGSVVLAVFVKRITNAAGEPGTWTLDWTGAQQGRAHAVRISGVHTSGNFWEVGTTNTGVGVTITSNEFNTSNDDQLCVAVHVADRDRINSGSTVGGLGWSLEIGQPGSSGGANGAGILLAEKDIATAGATEDANTGIASDGWAAIQVSLRSIEPEGFPHSQIIIIG